MERSTIGDRSPSGLTERLARARDANASYSSHVFADLAAVLLRSVELHAFGHECRLREIEFYVHSPNHEDPFTHCHEDQGRFAYWYLHRMGSGFKSGSFKGIDLAVGGEGTFGGILIRSIELGDGRVVNGSSLVVDTLLSFAEVATVRELHEIVSTESACDARNPLRLAWGSDRDDAVHASPRVGLSLKASHAAGPPLEFVLRRYRFLVGPRDIKKGRAHLVLALHRDGVAADRIREITGSPLKTINEYVEWADAGTGQTIDPATYAPTRARDLCQLSFELES